MARFLTTEWFARAAAIREEYSGRLAPPPTVIRMNLEITDCPADVGHDGVMTVHMDSTSGEMEVDSGHLDEPQLTVTLPYEVARAILVDGDSQASMQAFMSGRIKVTGDMTKFMAMQSGAADPAQAEIAARMRAITDDAGDAPPTVRPRYLPSTEGPLRDDDIAQALRLADLFGAWLNSLPDEEPRVPRAEATLRTLTGEMRLAEPDRVIVRRCSQIMIDLVSEELDELAAQLAAQLASRIEAAPDDPAISGGLSSVTSSITSAARHSDVVAWQGASGDLTDIVDEIEAAADVPPSDDAASGEAPGRGTRLRKAALYMGGGLAAGIMSAAGKATYEGVSSVLPSLIEQLLNVVGW